MGEGVVPGEVDQLLQGLDDNGERVEGIACMFG